MRISQTSSLLAIAAVLVAFPADVLHAQAADPIAQDGAAPPDSGPEPEDPANDGDTIVVLAARLIGQVDAPQPPVLELGAEEIAAYGAGSIAELLQSLGPQVSSGRGRGSGGGPVILVNGVRISSFREMRSYPPEAIEKIEVFNEEVAQQYGYSPDQRVVNFILKRNFSSREIEAEYGQPFDGGYSTQQVEATYLRIDGPSRLNFNLEWNNSSLLTEGERGVLQADGSVPDLASDPNPADYRSLVADSAGVEATANWTTKLGDSGNSLSINGTFERDDSQRLQGLDTVLLSDGVAGDPGVMSVLRAFNPNDPLTVDNRSQSYSGGATLNLGVGDWQVTGTTDGTYSHTRSLTQRRADTSALMTDASNGLLALDADLEGLVADAGFDEAITKTYTVNGLATARGNPVYLPGGDLSVTLDTGYRWNRINSMDTRNPGREIDLDRSRLQAGINLGVPITSKEEDFGGFLGNVSLNLSAGIDDLSDFGTLYDWTVGVTWGLTDALTVSASYINRDEAPSLSQLGSPEIATPNVPVFDLTNNETVLATVISGGNPDLKKQSQSDWKVGLIWELPILDQANFSFDYIRNHSENVASGFPTLTPAIEAAFSDRITRDFTGRLTTIDQRPVTFAQQDVERLQFGLNFSGQISGPEDAASSGQPRGPFGAGGPQMVTRGGDAPQGGAPGASQGAAPAGPPGGFGGASGAPGSGPNAEMFAQMRQTFCDAEPDALLALMNRAVAAAAAGEEPPLGPNGQPLAIPPQMLERLTGEDGQIDPERFTAIRDRICSGDAPAFGAGGPGQAAGGPPAGGGAPAGGAAGGPPGGGFGGRGGFRGPGGPGGPGGGGRWFFNLQYQLDLENTVLIAPGVPLLDLLDGDALTGGGQPRHSLSARMGVFYNGFGMLTFWNYSGKSRLDGSGLPGSTDLFFEDQLTVNLRAFADLGQREKLVEAIPLLDNARLGLGINNLFGSRQRVTDSNGDVPLRYQPFLLDPVGRSFEIEFRKLF